MKKQIIHKAGLFALLFGAMATMNSCSKDLPVAEADPTPSAMVAVHNFALLVPSNLTVMLNNANLSVLGAPASIAYGASLAGPYAGVKPGATTVGLRTLTGTADLVSKSATLVASSATSVFAFDTLTASALLKPITYKCGIKCGIDKNSRYIWSCNNWFNHFWKCGLCWRYYP
jgi:hypothetical protein